MHNCNTDSHRGWLRNTDLCVDVKTLLRGDRVTKIGKEYVGTLRKDTADHYTFMETLPQTVGKSRRNPQVYNGRYITVTRWADGSLHPNFKNVECGAINIEQYALGVYNEICIALGGLVEK